MSEITIDEKSRDYELQWVACMGDFALLRNFLSKKRSFFWILCAWLDALLRGFGQAVFANNPISGTLIIIAFAMTVPGTLAAGAGTGFLGLLLSLLLQDSRDKIGNGLTIYNPLLIGAVTYALAPNFYGRIDAFVISIALIGTIFSVYLTRSLGSGRFPCITVPFNVVQIILLLVLTMQGDSDESLDASEIVTEKYGEFQGGNSTVLERVDSVVMINESLVDENLNWGLFFRGIVTSASQVYAVDNVLAGSMIYLGILIYSPTTALFSLLGALTGCFVALSLKVPYAPIYAGLWGYNALLTGGALGGLFFIITGQTGLAAFVAIIFTTLFQYVSEPLLAKIGVPVLTIPFVVTAWLFFGLRDSLEGTFPRPASLTFPEHELHHFRTGLRDDPFKIANDDPEILCYDDKKTSSDEQ